MYTKALIIVIICVLIHPFLNHEKPSQVVFYTEIFFLSGGYVYCLITNLSKLQRASPMHEFKDDEERLISLGKKK